MAPRPSPVHHSVHSCEPDHGRTSGDTTVTVFGANFGNVGEAHGALHVYINGVACAQSRRVSDTEAVCVTPPGPAGAQVCRLLLPLPTLVIPAPTSELYVCVDAGRHLSRLHLIERRLCFLPLPCLCVRAGEGVVKRIPVPRRVWGDLRQVRCCPSKPWLEEVQRSKRAAWSLGIRKSSNAISRPPGHTPVHHSGTKPFHNALRGDSSAAGSPTPSPHA
jgi:hypothetical protein